MTRLVALAAALAVALTAKTSKVHPSAMGETRGDPTITHVVVPFHVREMSAVDEHLHRLERYPAIADAQGPRVHLVLYPSGREQPETRKRIDAIVRTHYDALAETGLATSVRWAGLAGDDDTYYRGTRLQIERVLAGDAGLPLPLGTGRTGDCHMLYMELDCRPVRVDWLGRLEGVVRAHGRFAVLGSALRGRPEIVADAPAALRLHVNGNALYNLGADPTDPLGRRGRAPPSPFAALYFYRVRPHVRAHFAEHAYDTDVAKWMLDAQNAPGVARTAAGLVQFTDAIHNMYHSAYDRATLSEHCPRAVLVHGGRDTAP